MGTTVASEIIGRASTILLDATNTRWSQPELLDWLNVGQRAIVQIRPDASAVTQAVQLAAGTKQTIPAGAVRIMRVRRNMGANGTTPGRAIRSVEFEVLDAQNPGWHTDDAAQVVRHVLFDPADPRVFYVWPPQPTDTPHQVEAVLSMVPDEVEDTDDPITLDDIYTDVLLDYILMRAYQKDSAYGENSRKAALFGQSFLTALGVKATADMISDLNLNAPPAKSPPVPSGVGGGQSG